MKKISLDELYERDGGMCRIGNHPIRRDEATRDHIRPRARGGGDESRNLQLACGPCNLNKGAKAGEWDFLPMYAPVGARSRSVL